MILADANDSHQPLVNAVDPCLMDGWMTEWFNQCLHD